MTERQEPLPSPSIGIDVLDWDEETKTFTIEGLRPDLHQLFRQRRTIPHLILRSHGAKKLLTNVKFIRIITIPQSSRTKTGFDPPPDAVQTVFWYEELP
jgi:hypothetical protein